MKHRTVIIELKTNKGAIILLKDIPTARKMVNSESLLNLSKVNSVPNNNPIGKAFPSIYGISQTKIRIPVLTVVSPFKICLITFKRISGAIHTIVKRSIATKVAPTICLKIYLSYMVIFLNIL